MRVEKQSSQEERETAPPLEINRSSIARGGYRGTCAAWDGDALECAMCADAQGASSLVLS